MMEHLADIMRDRLHHPSLSLHSFIYFFIYSLSGIVFAPLQLFVFLASLFFIAFSVSSALRSPQATYSCIVI